MQRSRHKKHFNSLLEEHWKRKQRLKEHKLDLSECQIIMPEETAGRKEENKATRDDDERRIKKTMSEAMTIECDVSRTLLSIIIDQKKKKKKNEMRTRRKKEDSKLKNNRDTLLMKISSINSDCLRRVHTKPRQLNLHRYTLITFLMQALLFIFFGGSSAGAQATNDATLSLPSASASNYLQLTDPRPTIYSGQVSFGLLLSAHSPLGTELFASSASQRSTTVNNLQKEPGDVDHTTTFDHSTPLKHTTKGSSVDIDGAEATTFSPLSTTSAGSLSNSNQILELSTTVKGSTTIRESLNNGNVTDSIVEPLATSESMMDSFKSLESRSHPSSVPNGGGGRQLDRRQIFDRPKSIRSNQQQQVSLNGKHTGSQLLDSNSLCSQINANALYAGMGAIWASHQANLVGDSQLTIGTYVYDSCNDLDIGQRQSVRIVSNLNAFQQTTCESPRGSPISLTIAHGDNQIKAIQLLTSFRVPVITTKEPFELEDYTQLSRDQRRFLFSTAHSSRHLAIGALRFSNKIVSRSLASQKHKGSSKNDGLIVISRNLPARFISYLTELIPNHVNYEMLQSHQPIDQIKSVEVLESILIKPSLTQASGTSESRISKITLVKPKDKRLDELDSHSDLDSAASNNDYESVSSDSGSINDEDTQTKITSPVILLFITPSEAIDLITRLRNDLVEVSRYYSLIVATREDISPALQTIFHRGGSRLCSGKAFYTISPKPDDISEFSRYFRDTVQMEGETSDHPLICEYAKYKSMTRTNTNLDDIGTEPVIKAVWAAAAAFKSVYRKECSTHGNNQTNIYRSNSDLSSTNSKIINSRQSGKTSECMIKMNKNLSTLVQKALKRLDFTINSTGLQALDGFRLKFDDMNELMTNKFSIKYINKDCEITDMGQYTGLRESSLKIEEETLAKSLESTLPEPWPIKPPPKPTLTTISDSTSSIADTSSVTVTNSPTTSTKSDLSNNGVSEGQVDTTDSTSTLEDANDRSNKRRPKGEQDTFKVPGEEDDPSVVEKGGSGSESNFNETPAIPTRLNKKLKVYEGRNVSNKRRTAAESQLRKRQQPVTASNKGMSGIGDSEAASVTEPTRERKTTDAMIVTSPKPMRKLKPFPLLIGTTVREWLPSNADITTTSTGHPPVELHPTTNSHLTTNTNLHIDDERIDPDNGRDLKMRGTTQAPVVYTTLPESDGNTDLDHPPTRTSMRQPTKMITTTTTKANLDTSATTDNSDYVTASSLAAVRSTESPSSFFGKLISMNPLNLTSSYRSISANGIEGVDSTTKPSARLSHPNDLSASPTPIISSPIPSVITDRDPRMSNTNHPKLVGTHLEPEEFSARSSRSKFRSHLNWIYNSWFGLTILAANICGALITLYVLTFLLMKNCDGSLDRQSQGIRSMHLLAIIVVFFGSTLFIVYPTPGLCLLRTSWQNFGLVLLFGSLLLQSMQVRSMSTLGLGGRPNRLNQFLTLIFIVGVQVSFELQRWKYESLNYINFVNQHFGFETEVNQRLSILSNSITSQSNPLNSFNDQVTPVSIKISEQYQNLLSDYCTQKAENFLQSQIYLFILVTLLVLFSTVTRRTSGKLMTNNKSTSKVLGSHHKLTSVSSGTSGQLVASEHEANLTPSHFQFATGNAMARGNLDQGNIFGVTLVCVPIYMVSVVLHIYGHNSTNRDLVSSVSMVAIAFSALIGIFLPVLRQIHRFEDSLEDNMTGGSSRRGALRQVQDVGQDRNSTSASHSQAFTMFPEFAPIGLRRPSSISGGSSSGSLRPFADTKESRRNMGAVLANLGPSADSLRGMGFYNSSDLDNRNEGDSSRDIDPAMLNLKLNLCANYNDMSPADELCTSQQQQQLSKTSRRVPSKGEKRLIMLDVDPCCPRHGVAAWPRGEPTSTKNCKPKALNPIE